MSTPPMTYVEYMSYAAEINTLQRLLNGLTHERRLERFGLEHRLRKAQQKIEDVVPPRPKPLAASFDGEPVHASRGINATFAAAAVAMVSDAVRLTTAAMTGELSRTGQIPRNALGQAIITGVTLGSFGFEMELPAQDHPNRPDYPEEAVKQVQELLRSVIEDTDDELSNTAASMHTRAVNKVADLLGLMRRSGAQFTLEYQGNTVAFRTETEVRNAARRLNPSNVEDRTADVVGRMAGVVPATRTFELDPSDGPPIVGRVGIEIRNPYEIAQRFNNREIRATIRTVRIGRSAPKHTLVSVSAMPNRGAETPNPNSL